MKKTPKALSFKATVVRTLSARELELAAGGGSSATSTDTRVTCSVTFQGSCNCNSRVAGCFSDECTSDCPF